MSYWAIWLVIVILLTVMEAATVNLVSIWFIASGIVALFVSLICESFFVQFGVFVILGILLLLLTRPMLLKMISGKDNKTNLDRIIGMEGIVTSKIKKNTIGEVKVDGKLWSAMAKETIEEGCVVKVIAMESVKLIVEKLEEKEEAKLEEAIVEEAEKEVSVEVAEKKSTPKKASAAKKSNTSTTKKKRASTTAKKKTTTKKSTAGSKTSTAKKTTSAKKKVSDK